MFWFYLSFSPLCSSRTLIWTAMRSGSGQRARCWRVPGSWRRCVRPFRMNSMLPLCRSVPTLSLVISLCCMGYSMSTTVMEHVSHSRMVKENVLSRAIHLELASPGVICFKWARPLSKLLSKHFMTRQTVYQIGANICCLFILLLLIWILLPGCVK